MRSTALQGGTYDKASIALVLIVLAIILATFYDYGITWDEPLQDEYGDLVVEYYRSRLGDEPDNRALDFHNLYLYGGAFDSLVALARKVSPFPRFETRHFINALIGLLGIVGCWRLTRSVSGASAAFWATVLLVVTPRFYGHMFNNPKDIPFAVGYVWSVYYLVIASRQLPKVTIATAAKLAVVIGLTMGVRVGGLILLLYWGAILVAFGLYRLVDRERRQTLLPDSGHLTMTFLQVAAPAYLIMLAAWPWAQLSPFRNPLKALERISRFRWNRPVLFDGFEFKARNLPASYYTHYFSIALPEILLVLLPLAVAVALVVVARRRATLDPIKVTALAIVAFAAVYPLIHVASVKAVVYDGIRHLLFVLPPLACLAGTTLAWLIRGSGSKSGRFQTLLLLALGIYLAFQASVMIRLHPYQTVYFNSFVGGLPGAAGRYETDYWGNSYREAALELESFIESKVKRGPSRILRAKVCSTYLSSAYYFPSYLRRTGKDWRADFYIATTRWRCDEMLDGRVIATVERYGVPLAVVKDRRHLRRKSDPTQ